MRNNIKILTSYLQYNEIYKSLKYILHMRVTRGILFAHVITDCCTQYPIYYVTVVLSMR